MPLRKWVDSANNAIEGILHAARTQRHLRYHLTTAVLVLVLSYMLGVVRTDFLIIAIITILVLLAEMLNTAIELLVDVISPNYSEKARIIKDVAAGAVLITAFGAVVIGYIVLFPYLTRAFEAGMLIARHSHEEVALISIIIVMIMVVMLKARFGAGHPLRGGMPSGHSAIAFSLWMTITLMTENFAVSIVCFILALMVAQSRVAVRVHSPVEVFMGALLGSLVTLFLSLIFR
jgi:diacylglycerol kinase (ATP)